MLCPTPCIGRSLRHLYVYIYFSLAASVARGGRGSNSCRLRRFAGATSNGPPNEPLPRTVGKLCELIWNSSKCRISFWQLQQTGNAACSPNSSIYLAWRGSRDRCTAAIHLSLSASLTCSPPLPLPLFLSRSRMCVKHIKIIFFFARQNARWQLPHTLPEVESAPPHTSSPLSLSPPLFLSLLIFIFLLPPVGRRPRVAGNAAIVATGWHQIGPHSV